MAFSAFLDTCVLVPSTLRDLLLEIATHQGFRPLWSTGVESELHRVITRLHAEAGKSSEETTAYIKRLLLNMNAALPDARVSGYEWMENSIVGLPDKNDRHVVAAATHGQASVIVTFNLKDFPAEHLPGSLFSQSPDDFLLDLLDLSPVLIQHSLHQISKRSGRHGPRWETNDILERLRKELVPHFCDEYHSATAS